jgi:hypothetical protein
MQSDSVDRSILAFTSRALPQRARLAFLELENLSFITANDSFFPSAKQTANCHKRCIESDA